MEIPINAMYAIRYERIQGDRVYIGNRIAATLEGDRERGFIIRYPDQNGNGYAPNITRALRKIRINYWASRGL